VGLFALPAVEGVWYSMSFGRTVGAVRGTTVGGNNSVVECDLAKVEVAGSNPVSRSNLDRRGPLHPAWGGGGGGK
jgi:hypothetical protein